MISTLELEPFSLFFDVEETTQNLGCVEDGMPNPWALDREEEERMAWRWEEMEI